MSEIVCPKQVDNLGWRFSLSLGGDTKLKLVDLTNFVMKHIEAIPLLFLIDEVGALLKLVDVVHNSSSILPL